MTPLETYGLTEIEKKCIQNFGVAVDAAASGHVFDRWDDNFFPYDYLRSLLAPVALCHMHHRFIYLLWNWEEE